MFKVSIVSAKMTTIATFEAASYQGAIQRLARATIPGWRIHKQEQTAAIYKNTTNNQLAIIRLCV